MTEPSIPPLPNAPLPVALGQLEACVAAVGADSEAQPLRRAEALAAIEKDRALLLEVPGSATAIARLKLAADLG